MKKNKSFLENVNKVIGLFLVIFIFVFYGFAFMEPVKVLADFCYR